MVESPLNFPLETLALPHEDPGVPERPFKEFDDAYPGSDPIALGLILQAVLQTRLNEDGTWYGGDMFWAIMIQGFSARLDQLYFSEAAYLTWMSCPELQPYPRQFEIDRPGFNYKGRDAIAPRPAAARAVVPPQRRRPSSSASRLRPSVDPGAR
jgi:hypothetical protein